MHIVGIVYVQSIYMHIGNGLAFGIYLQCVFLRYNLSA